MARHSARARRALAHLADHDPALAALALWCDHRDGEGATHTRGETIHYGLDFESLPLHEQVGLAGHHILHVALRHSPRMAAMAARQGASFDTGQFNIAADAIVNTSLLAAGHGLPRPAVTLADLPGIDTESPGGWDVERLYLALQRSVGPAERTTGAEGSRDLQPNAGESGEDAAAAWQGRMERALAAGRQAGRGIGAARGTLG
uniref:DUF2201 family putative metallopeptidase n=1 Tax=Oceaniglobus roseus TaxID=1737570 RepID=UPI003CCBF342